MHVWLVFSLYVQRWNMWYVKKVSYPQWTGGAHWQGGAFLSVWKSLLFIFQKFLFQSSNNGVLMISNESFHIFLMELLSQHIWVIKSEFLHTHKCLWSIIQNLLLHLTNCKSVKVKLKKYQNVTPSLAPPRLKKSLSNQLVFLETPLLTLGYLMFLHSSQLSNSFSNYR